MSGIVEQFANSPINKEIRNLTVVSGTYSAMVTGSVSSPPVLMWRAKSRPTNGGDIFISAKDDGSEYWTLDAGDDTGWIAGAMRGFYFSGDIEGDILEIWEQK